MTLCFLKVFQIFYPITCKCKFHIDGQNVHAIELLQTCLLHLCIFTPDYILLSLKVLNSHTRRFWLLHAMYSSYICAQQRTTTLQKPYFLQLERRLFLSLFLVFHLYLYPLVSVYKTQTESYKREKHKNPNKK